MEALQDIVRYVEQQQNIGVCLSFLQDGQARVHAVKGSVSSALLRNDLAYPNGH
jgi:hypothetical protein